MFWFKLQYVRLNGNKYTDKILLFVLVHLNAAKILFKPINFI